MARRARKLHGVQSPDEGIVIVPYSFRVNGTSAGDDLSGDTLVSAAFSEAGEYLLTFRDKFASCLFSPPPSLANVADDVDLYAKIDPTDVCIGGTATVRCMTGATQTTPTDNTLISGVLICKKSTRVSRRA